MIGIVGKKIVDINLRDRIRDSRQKLQGEQFGVSVKKKFDGSLRVVCQWSGRVMFFYSERLSEVKWMASGS